MVMPLTLERFRICEFYAELLHCSNMSLVNRPLSSPNLYSKAGYLAAGWQAADDLAEALAGVAATPSDDDEQDYSAIYRLPPQLAVSTAKSSPSESRSSYSTSPVDVRGSYSGLSTPSGTGSLDSESGILTRAEARELKDLVALSGEDEDGESDPFGDPADEDDKEDEESEEEAARQRLAKMSLVTEGLDTRDKIESPTAQTPRPSTEDTLASRRQRSPTPKPPSPKPRPKMPPGPLLKHQFMEHRVVETMLVSLPGSPAADVELC